VRESLAESSEKYFPKDTIMIIFMSMISAGSAPCQAELRGLVVIGTVSKSKEKAWITAILATFFS
jgi:hypothetical protein